MENNKIELIFLFFIIVIILFILILFLYILIILLKLIHNPLMDHILLMIIPLNTEFSLTFNTLNIDTSSFLIIKIINAHILTPHIINSIIVISDLKILNFTILSIGHPYSGLKVVKNLLVSFSSLIIVLYTLNTLVI